jgi:hypothetical protein
VVDGVRGLTSFGQQGSDLAEIGWLGGPQDEPSWQWLTHLARVPATGPTVDRIRPERRTIERFTTSDATLLRVGRQRAALGVGRQRAALWSVHA